MFKLPWTVKNKKAAGEELFKDAKASKRAQGLETLKASKLAADAIARCASLVEEAGPRPAGSEASRRCARSLLSDFSSWADDAVITTARGSEASYWGSLKALAVSSWAMLLFCWLGLPIVALPLGALAAFNAWKTFFTCSAKAGRFGKHVDLTNVHAVLETGGEINETIVFTAHHDSARVMAQGRPLVNLHLPLAHFCVVLLASLCLFLSDLFTLSLFKANFPALSFAILLGFLTISSPVQWKLFRIVGSECSPGAADNLVSSCVLVQLSRYFSWKRGRGELRPGLRLVFASFDGEECALQGSSAWYAAHGALLVNPAVINLDCLMEQGSLVFLTKDVNGFETLSESLASELAAEAAAMGWQAKVGALPLFSGATDAASAARAGLKATTMMGMELGSSSDSVIHTSGDTPDKLDRRAVEEAISVCIKFVEKRKAATGDGGKVSALDDPERKFLLTN